MGLIAQNMGRNTSEIETYLKEFDVENIYRANLKLFVSEQDEYKDKVEELRNETRQKLKEQGRDKTLEWFEELWQYYDEDPLL